ncbi:MAG TPA: hypothetical protein VFN11_02360 [Ktedonobacterales bacterium]|nr:hypothetical protein [Ktedonobacterales bacterium]
MSEMEQWQQEPQGQPDANDLRYYQRKRSEITASIDWMQGLQESLDEVDYDWRRFYASVANWPQPVREADRAIIEMRLRLVWNAVAELRNAAYYYIYPEERTNPDNEGEWDAGR